MDKKTIHKIQQKLQPKTDPVDGGLKVRTDLQAGEEGCRWVPIDIYGAGCIWCPSGKVYC